MDAESDYVVVRAGKGLPEGFLPPGLDGTWYDLARMPNSVQVAGGATFVPTGRFEVRGDGAVAEVWELRV